MTRRFAPPIARVALVVSLLLALGPSVLPGVDAVAAQDVSGEVVGTDPATPVAGALVLLLGSEEEQVGGVLTDDAGRFRIRSVPPGRYRLVVRRIGFADGGTDWFELADDAPVDVRIELQVAAIALEGITAEPDRRCRTIEEDDASTLGRLWEEARKALELTRFTESSGEILFLARTYERDLAPNLDIRSESVRHQRGIGVLPFTSAPPESLAQSGYVQNAGDGGWHYFGPDAAALMSSPFLNTHCLRFHEDHPTGDSIGIRIEPIPGRQIPDIRGVLWIDRRNLELRRLDFRYVHTDLPAADRAEHMGGSVEFESLSTGAWIVRRWAIRMPTIGARRRLRGRVQYSVEGYLEVGGVVVEVWNREGEPLRRGSHPEEPPPG